MKLLNILGLSAAGLIATGCTNQTRVDPSITKQALEQYRTTQSQVETPPTKTRNSPQDKTQQNTSLPQSIELQSSAPPKPKNPITLESYTISDVVSRAINAQLNLYSDNFRGGVGTLFKEGDLNYISGVTTFPTSLGEASLIFHGLNDNGRGNQDAFTLQGSLDFGNLNIGGGYLDFPGRDNDSGFARVLTHKDTDKFEYVLGGHIRQTPSETIPGVSALLRLKDILEKKGFDVYGGVQHDRLQTRYAIGATSPVLNEDLQLQPAFDFLHVDNREGAKFTLANLTLGHRGRFYTSENKIGRLLGATGAWSPNPIYGTDSSLRHNLNWNRLGDPWKTGDLLNVQYLQLDKPNGKTGIHLDGLVLPFQTNDISPFLGWTYDSFDDKSRHGPLFGTSFKIGNATGSFNVNVFNDREVAGSFGISIPLK